MKRRWPLVLMPAAVVVLTALAALPPASVPVGEARLEAQGPRVVPGRPQPRAEQVNAPEEEIQTAQEAVKVAAINTRLFVEDIRRHLPPGLQAKSADELAYQRTKNFLYLSFHNISQGKRRARWQALAGHVNAIAGKGASLVVPPVLVFDDGTEKPWQFVLRQDWDRLLLARVEVTDYSWPADLRDKLAEQGFYFSVNKSAVKRDQPRVIFEKVLFDKKTYWPDKDGVYWVGDTRPNVPEDKRWIKATEWKDGDYWVRPVGPVPPAPNNTKDEVIEPFWLKQRDPETDTALCYLQKMTGQRFPIERADNFVWQTAVQKNRVVGYYGIQQLKSRDDFFQLVGFNKGESLDYSDEFLSNIAISGVARSCARRLGRFRRMVWTTFDNEVAVGERNPLRVLDNKSFKHQAEEHIGFGANGFQKAYLSDDQGKQQDVAPQFVGFDKTAPDMDANIHPYVSCVRCHAALGDGGLAFYKHWQQNLNRVRRDWDPPLVPLLVKDEKQFLQLRNQYLQGLDFWFKRDGSLYAYALRQANGLAVNEFAAVLGEAWADYVAPVTMERAARELGLTKVEFRQRLLRYDRTVGNLDPVLSEFLLPEDQQHPIGVEQWQEVFPLAQLAIAGLAQPADLGVK